MGIYGNSFNDIKYDCQLSLIESFIENDKAIYESLEVQNVLEESVGSVIKGFISKIKKLFDRIINFLKSIPGKIASIFNKSVKKAENNNIKKEIDKKEKDPEIPFEEKEYENDLYDYSELIGSLFDRSNFMMDSGASGYKSFVNIEKESKEFTEHFGSKVNANYFNKFDTYKELQDYVKTDEYLNNFIIKNKSSVYIRDNLSKFEKQTEDIEYISKKAQEYQKSWEKIMRNISSYFEDDVEYTGDLLKTVERSTAWEDKIEKDGLDIKSLNAYYQFAFLSVQACIIVFNTAIIYAPKAASQYNSVLKFVNSCYKTK